MIERPRLSIRELARIVDALVPCPEPDCALRYVGLAPDRLRAHLREAHRWSPVELRGRRP